MISWCWTSNTKGSARLERTHSNQKLGHGTQEKTQTRSPSKNSDTAPMGEWVNGWMGWFTKVVAIVLLVSIVAHWEEINTNTDEAFTRVERLQSSII